MGCNCKNGQSVDTMMQNSVNDKNKSIGQTTIKYILKIFIFLLFLLALPIINLYIIYLGFTMLVLNRKIDVKPMLLAIASKFKEKEVYDEDDFETFTEDDLVLTNVDDITNRVKSK